jgi:hypothetical protein
MLEADLVRECCFVRVQGLDCSGGEGQGADLAEERRGRVVGK